VTARVRGSEKKATDAQADDGFEVAGWQVGKQARNPRVALTLAEFVDVDTRLPYLTQPHLTITICLQHDGENRPRPVGGPLSDPSVFLQGSTGRL
jgi:hypothetical protein